MPDPTPSRRLGPAVFLALLAMAAAPAQRPSPSPSPSPPAAPRAEPAAPAATIRGRVVGPDGAAVAKTTVRVVPDDAARDPAGAGRRRAPSAALVPVRVEGRADGSFELSGLSGASFTVRVDAESFSPFTQKGVPAGATIKVALQRGHPLAGIVRDASTRRPVAGAVVLGCDPEAARFGEEGCRRATSGDDGAFALADLPRGAIAVAVRAPRYAAGSAEPVSVPRSAPKEGESVPPLEVYLRPGGRLAGRVRDGDGKAIAGATLSVTPLDQRIADFLRESPTRPIRSDAAGAFAFDGLPVGRYRLRGSAEGLAGAELGPFEIAAGTDRSDVEMRLDRGAAFKVRIVDPEGKPVRGLAVELQATGERARGRLRFGGDEVDDRRIREWEEGRYTVVQLEPGTFTVRLLPEDREEVEKENVKLRDGETADLGTIVAREGRSVSGRVTDRASSPIAGAEVVAIWSGEGGGFKSRRVRSKDDGRYRIPGLGEQPVQAIRVRAAGYASADRQDALPGDRGVDFVLDRTGSVAGRVVTADGGIPVAFRVRAHPEATAGRETGPMRMFLRGSSEGTVFSDPAGNFRLDDVEPGSYTIEAIAERFVPAKQVGVKVEAERLAEAGTLTLREGATLRGRVLDARDDSPVAGALVRIETPSTTPLRLDGAGDAGAAVSAMDGAFTIAGLDGGVYVAAVEHSDFSPSRVRVEVQSEQALPELVVKLSRGGTLTGTVRDAQRQPQADVRLIVFQGMGQDPRTVVTGGDGVYALDRLAPGSYQVMKSPEGRSLGRGFAAKSAAIREGETTVLDFDDAPKVLVRGRVLRGSEPIPGVTLVFTPADGAPGEIGSGDADGEGRFQVGLETGGSYLVLVQDPGLGRFRGRRNVRVEVPDRPEANVDVILPVAVVTGRVANEEGEAVSSAMVTARVAADGADLATTTVTASTEPDGTFRLEGLDPGGYRVTARAEGYRSPDAKPVEVVEGVATAPIEIRLERGRAIRGRVVDPQGRGVAQSIVFVAPSGGAAGPGPGPMVRTDVNGAFVTTSPSEGPIDVTAIPPGWAPIVRKGEAPPARRGGRRARPAGEPRGEDRRPRARPRGRADVGNPGGRSPGSTVPRERPGPGRPPPRSDRSGRDDAPRPPPPGRLPRDGARSRSDLGRGERRDRLRGALRSRRARRGASPGPKPLGWRWGGRAAIMCAARAPAGLAPVSPGFEEVSRCRPIRCSVPRSPSCPRTRRCSATPSGNSPRGRSAPA